MPRAYAHKHANRNTKSGIFKGVHVFTQEAQAYTQIHTRSHDARPFASSPSLQHKVTGLDYYTHPTRPPSHRPPRKLQYHPYPADQQEAGTAPGVMVLLNHVCVVLLQLCFCGDGMEHAQALADAKSWNFIRKKFNSDVPEVTRTDPRQRTCFRRRPQGADMHTLRTSPPLLPGHQMCREKGEPQQVERW